jgi:rhamnopyranosyl-N-acetylglucosaminyl-diphospho-decaprenol beta-1,3/1,4-galactofuranosyltransferase
VEPPALKVLATVVTRNRVGMLDNALRLLCAQSRLPAAILVVDNDSAPDTAELVAQWRNRNPLVQYLNTGRNAGSGGGQKEAMRYAVEHGYDVIYTMDDDCEPEADALEKILAAWEPLPDREQWAMNSLVLDVARPEVMSFGLVDNIKIGSYTPTTIYHRMDELPPGRLQNGLYIGGGCLFNGTLVPTRFIRRAGYPREDLFIRGDEGEYCFRLMSQGQVATVIASRVRHPGEAAVSSGMAPWKRYYSVRNSVIIKRLYFPSVRSSRPYLLLRAAKHRLLASLGRDPSVNRTLALAIYDGCFGRFDRDAFALK